MRPSWRMTIAALEIVGGVFGLLQIVVELVRHTDSGDTQTQLVALGFFALSLCAGIQLWRNARGGYAMSVIVQLVQFPKIVSGSAVFMMSFGLDVWVMAVESPGAGRGLTMAIWGGAYHLLHAGDTVGKGLGFSIVSSVALVGLLKGMDAKRATAAPAVRVGQDPTPDERDASGRGVPSTDSPPDPWAWTIPRWAKVAVVLLMLLVASCVALQNIP